MSPVVFDTTGLYETVSAGKQIERSGPDRLIQDVTMPQKPRSRGRKPSLQRRRSSPRRSC